MVHLNVSSRSLARQCVPPTQPSDPGRPSDPRLTTATSVVGLPAVYRRLQPR